MPCKSALDLPASLVRDWWVIALQLCVMITLQPARPRQPGAPSDSPPANDTCSASPSVEAPGVASTILGMVILLVHHQCRRHHQSNDHDYRDSLLYGPLNHPRWLRRRAALRSCSGRCAALRCCCCCSCCCHVYVRCCCRCCCMCCRCYGCCVRCRRHGCHQCCCLVDSAGARPAVVCFFEGATSAWDERLVGATGARSLNSAQGWGLWPCC